MTLVQLLPVVVALLGAPLLPGAIGRVKAIAAGRTGPPLVQSYCDLARLLRKGAVYSTTATWVFRAAPPIALAASILALFLLPAGGVPAPFAFAGDVVLLASLLALTRLALVFAALDTGSSFEGMGASRELLVSSLAEPALFLGLAAMVIRTESLSLSALSTPTAGPVRVLVAGALLLVFLAENARIPVDDPSTHLELSMIHEVMLLDSSGPDLAFLRYAAALKMWVLGAVVVDVAIPWRTGAALLDGGGFLLGLAALVVLTGVVESTMARLRLTRLPQLLVGAAALSALALVFVLW